MSPGKRRARRRTGPWLAAVPVVALAAGVGLFVLLRSGGDPPAPPEPRPTRQPPFAFTAGAVEFVPVDREAVPADPEAATLAVTDVMSDIYDAGFVSAARWEGGRFGGVLQHFDDKARARAEIDLGSLTLGPEARVLRSVAPGPSSLELSFLVEKDQPVAAIAEASFQGTGELRKGGLLAIAHGGTYYLQRVEGTWRITGYRVHGTLDTPASTPTAGPTP